MFKMIYKQSLGDATDVYDIEFDKSILVGDFAGYVLQNKTNEWGTIHIRQPGESFIDSLQSSVYLEYQKGNVVSDNLPESICNKKIVSATANGGWSRMDYMLIVD